MGFLCAVMGRGLILGSKALSAESDLGFRGHPTIQDARDRRWLASSLVEAFKLFPNELAQIVVPKYFGLSGVRVNGDLEV